MKKLRITLISLGVLAAGMASALPPNVALYNSLYYVNQHSGAQVTSSGYQQTYQMNLPSDANTIINVFSSSVAPRTSVLTNFVDLTAYRGPFMIHLSWTDTLKTGGSQDSLLFRLIPVGKASLTNDGFDYYVPTVGATGAAADTTGMAYGWVVGSPVNLWAANYIGKTPFYTNQYRTGPQPGVSGYNEVTYIYNRSIPLSISNSMSVNENMVGFLVQNLGGHINGKSIIHTLSIDIVAKAN